MRGRAEGVYLRGKFVATSKGKATKEYGIWRSMITRVYCEKHLKKSPTYVGCEVSDNFKNFQYFAEWCQHQKGFENEGWELDKDIIVKGNKLYSETTCCFVPQEINTLLTLNNKNRGPVPVGVSYYKPLGKFCAKLKVDGVNKHIGYFSDPIEAFESYKKEKQHYIKLKAEKFKGPLSEKVYTSLLNWSLEYSD